MKEIINSYLQHIQEVRQQDLKSVQDFLVENKLKPSIKINSNSLYFFVQNEGQVIGTIGAEFNQQYALIRATGVAQEYRGQGIAQKLLQRLTTELEEKGIIHLYLFSRQAARFWTSVGFTQCAIQEVIQVLPDAPQVIEFLADNSIWTDVAWSKVIKIHF
ncbi:MAG: GNAT family N-acetyltransferase [Cyclobacteriaceae bacterium]|nr:GNAT family N-acetyltransferase [Cyclobacteriaceae bacterium]